MNFITLFIGIIVAVLIYLHLRQSELIFCHNLKIARFLILITLCVMGTGALVPSMVPAQKLDPGIIRFGMFLYAAIIWTLSILAFWNILQACYKDAFFKRIGKADQNLHQKISCIILEAANTKKFTAAFKLFIKTRFDDSTLNTIRIKCKEINNIYESSTLARDQFWLENGDKLKELANKLG